MMCITFPNFPVPVKKLSGLTSPWIKDLVWTYSMRVISWLIRRRTVLSENFRSQKLKRSSVCSAAFQFASTFDFLRIQGGIYSLNRVRTILCSGANMRAEQYNWSGAWSITDRLYKANRFASRINACKVGLLSTLI